MIGDSERGQGGAGVPATRRQFLAGLALAGGGALLAACGATATPTIGALTATAVTGAPSVAASPTLAGTPPTVGAGVPATVSRTAAPAETATRAASPAATSTRVAGTPSATELGRLLTLVPRMDDYPDRGIWFADPARQKRNYGFEGVASLDAVRALPGGGARFINAVEMLPLPIESGIQHVAVQQWRSLLGYDFWQVERSIFTGDPPQVWARLEGRFDRGAIETALIGQGYATVSYRDRVFLSRYEDAYVQLSDPISRLVLSHLNRVAIEDGALTTSAFTANIEAGIDAAAGRWPSFGADPDYAALATALGSVVGAVLLPAEGLRPQVNQGPNARATPSARPQGASLRPYRLVGLGLRDDGVTHTMVIALVYADAADARVDAPILRRRVEDYTLFATRQRLRERAAPGEPAIVSTGGRAVLVQPFAITDEPNLSLYLKLLNTRDLLFLAD